MSKNLHALMQKVTFLLVFSMVIGILFISLNDSFAQSVIPPRHQWKDVNDIDQLTCKEGLMLLQKSNGAPACVSPTAYLKLVDRGYGVFDSSLLTKRPAMTESLIKNITSNKELMSHWHDMMQDNPKIMQESMKEMVSQMKNNQKLFDHVMSPMVSNPELRIQMIEIMKSHPHMEGTMHADERWMSSVHMPNVMNKTMGNSMNKTTNHSMNKDVNHGMSGMSHGMNKSMSDNFRGFSNYDRMMDMMHSMWIDSGLMAEMHKKMLENPHHMEQMSDKMMRPMLTHMMDDPEIRQKMIEYMLEHEEFMNTIRHENAN